MSELRTGRGARCPIAQQFALWRSKSERRSRLAHRTRPYIPGIQLASIILQLATLATGDTLAPRTTPARSSGATSEQNVDQ